MTAPLISTSWQGQLAITYACSSTKTQVVQAQATAPLKIQRPFYPEGDAICHSVILHTAGGVVGGDQLMTKVHLQPHASALITTAAATKIYRSAGAKAQQTLQVTLEANTVLEYLPQPTIVFSGAHYHQHMRVDLAPGAVWLGWDLVRFGRSARDEQFQQGYWRSSTELWQGPQPQWLDRQQLIGGSDLLAAPNGLHHQPVIGTLALVGFEVDTALLHMARSLPLPTSPHSTTGITRLMTGLLCRYRGPSTSEAQRWMMALWQLLRPHYLQRSPCRPRVW